MTDGRSKRGVRKTVSLAKYFAHLLNNFVRHFDTCTNEERMKMMVMTVLRDRERQTERDRERDRERERERESTGSPNGD